MPKIYHKRQNDFQKTGYQPKSLMKEHALFVPNKKIEFYGGNSSNGPHIKENNRPKNAKQKIYYLATHDHIEYFGMEILNLIGFATAKSRPSTIPYYLSENSDVPYLYNPMMVVAEIEQYIPIAAVLKTDSIPQIVKSSKTLSQIYAKYTLDFTRQVMIDLETGEKFKINGNLFTANIGANLLADKDFQPNGLNVGFVKIGRRFFTHFIDKEGVSFTGLKYIKNIDKTDKRVLASDLFKYATQDQMLYIVNQVRQAIKDRSFERIFNNARINSTLAGPGFNYTESDLHNFCFAFLATSKSCVKYYIKQIGQGQSNTEIFRNFAHRESLRQQVAGLVINSIGLILNDKDKQALAESIMEDLRGPYYQHLFTNKMTLSGADIENDELLHAIQIDLIQEIKATSLCSLLVLVNDMYDFIQAEISRLEIKKSTKKINLYKNFLHVLEEIQSKFTQWDDDERIRILGRLVIQLDKLSAYSTAFIKRKTPTSQNNWHNFKLDHAAYFDIFIPEQIPTNAQAPARSSQQFFSSGNDSVANDSTLSFTELSMPKRENVYKKGRQPNP